MMVQENRPSAMNVVVVEVGGELFGTLIVSHFKCKLIFFVSLSDKFMEHHFFESPLDNGF